MGMLSLGVLVALCLTLPPLLVRGWINNWDQPFSLACPRGQFLQKINSKHHNRHEDRRFDLRCGPLPSLRHGTSQCDWSGYVNQWDQPVTYQCPGNRYMAGMDSYHHNKHEDRRFRFYCCSVPQTRLSDCSYTNWQNGFDDRVAFQVPNGKILRGMISIHHNKHEDRRFKFQTCRISNQ